MTFIGAVTDPAVATILVADDHPLFREAMYQVVQESFSAFQVVELSDYDTTFERLRLDDTVELVLLDLNMPGMTGFSGLEELRRTAPAVPVVIVSATDDRGVATQAVAMGAAGYLPKSMPRAEMAKALLRIMNGEVVVPDSLAEPGTDPFGLPAATAPCAPAPQPDELTEDDQRVLGGLMELTGQQRKVLEMLIEGKSNKIIAFELSIAESTVKAHVSAILRKMHVHSRTQAVVKAGRLLPLI